MPHFIIYHTIYQFIKPFLDKKCLFLRNMESFIVLLFQHLLFICLNYASLPTAYLTASIGFLNSTIHDEGPEI